MDSPANAGSGLKADEVKRRHILPKALVIGLAAGLLASAFRIALDGSESLRIGWIHRERPLIGLAVALAIGGVGGGLGVWLVRRFAPEAAGSGIPHLKSIVLGEDTMEWRRLLPVKFVAGLAAIGGGFALGREGPTIQMGGASGLMVSGWFRVKAGEGERKALVCAGAGAGLAAAFNAPLAGMIFVLEELQVGLTPVIFVAAFLASVIADVVARVLAGSQPVFDLKGIPAPGYAAIPGALVIGALAGFGGVVFNRSLLKSMDLFDRRRLWPPFAVGALVGAAMGLAGWLVPGLAGTGGRIAQEALGGGLALGAVLLLLVARYLMTMASYGCGAAGGIFIPLFVLGSLGGLSFGLAGHAVLPGLFASPAAFAVLGMGALFAAIVRAPLTGLVLMIEMTGTYDFMLPLLASCFVSYGVAEAMGDRPIYEALRLRARARRAVGSPKPSSQPQIPSPPAG